MKNARFLQVFFNLFHGLMAGLIANVLLLVPLPANSQNWEPLGPDDFDQLSFSYASYVHAAKGPGQSLYVVFQDQSSGFKALAWQYADSVWTKLGTEPISTGVAAYTDIAVDNQGVPYVVYQDVAAGYKATVKKFSGGNWVAVGEEGFSTASVIYTRIAIAPDGTPFVIYRDNAEASKATVKKFNGTAWVTVGTAGISIGVVDWTSIAIDSDGVPFITYTDFGIGTKATVKKFNGTAWVNAGNSDVSDGVAGYTEIALSSTNVPYVLFRDFAEGNKAIVKQLNGLFWTTVGPGAISDANTEHLTIAITPHDTVCVAYRDWSIGGGVTAKRFNGIEWETMGEEGLTGSSADYLSLVAMDDDNLCLAYAGGGKARVTCYKGGVWKNLNRTGITEYFPHRYQMCPNVNNFPYVTFTGGGITDPWHIPIMIYTPPPPSWTLLSTLPTILPPFTGQQYLLQIDIEESAGGSLYSAYLGNVPDSTSPNGIKGIVKVMHYDGVEWMNMGDVEPLFKNITTLDFALDKTGTPYVACIYYDQMYKLAVARYNGSEWELVGDIFFTDISHFKLAFSGNNTPFIAYRKYSTNKITVKKFNGAEWETVGTEDFVSSLTGGVSGGMSHSVLDFAVAAEDTPYLMYRDADDYRIHVLQYDGDQWKQLGDAVSPLNSEHFGLGLAGNTPYALFAEDAENDKGIVKKWDGQAWTILGGVPFSADIITFPNISVKSDRTVFVAYTSIEGDLFVKSYADACTAPANISGPDTVLINQTAAFSAPAGFTSYLWNAGSGVVSGGQGTAHAQVSFPVSGNITVSITVTDSDGCTGTATQSVLVPGVISTHTLLSPTLRIASNPFSDFLFFEVLQGAGSISRISISDAVGRIWWEQAEAPEGIFDIETALWPSGIYFLQVESGGMPAIWRVVKN